MIIPLTVLNSARINSAFAATSAFTLALGERIELPSAGGFDYMAFDASTGNVLASHTGAKSLAVYNTQSKTIHEIATGGVNGLEVVPQWNQIFAGGGGDVLCAINRKSLKIENKVSLSGHGDALAVDTKDHLVFQCHDDNQNIWVFDSRTLKQKGDVAISGIPEYIVYDPKTGYVFQNIKDKNEIDVINPRTLKVLKTWATPGLETPSGLVLDPSLHVLVCTGRNGVAMSFDPFTGKNIGTGQISPSIDQSALDPSWHLVYSAGHGFVSVLKITQNGLGSLGSFPVSKGAHTITVDPRNHDVWICYSESGHAYLQVLHPQFQK